MKLLKNFTRSEQSLLLYLETRAVDYSGAVDGARMNAEDFQIAEQFKSDGFIEFGRIHSGSIPYRSTVMHWVKLSDKAWRYAHTLRKERALKRWEEKRLN